MSSSSPSSSTTHLVLVADDEPAMLELVANHLKTHRSPKLEILEASDGEQAWQLARDRLPDLVVLDVMMPGMSGWDVCRRIRENVGLAHTSVVMLTGIGENLNQMTSPLFGADAYLDKPFEFDDLDAKVAEALAARASMRGNVARPPVNGVAGPAKVAPASVARTASKKAAPAAAKKAAPKKAKAAAKAVVAKKAKVAPKKGAVKKGVLPKAKAAKAKPKAAAKKAGPKKGSARLAPAKRPAAKKKAAKKAPARKPAPKKAPAKKKKR
jgi:DNA-binding response OmpR family regulator